jgi:calmodulin
LEIIKPLQKPVTFDQFVNEILYRNNGSGFKPIATVDDFLQGFQVFDKDANGFISAGELRYILTCLGEKLSDSQVDDLLKNVEQDKNGLINYESFIRTIMSG